MARGGKGNRGGSGHIGGHMGRNMPNTLGGNLNDYTSWNTVSHGISGAKKLINQWGISASQISNKVEKHNAATRDDEYTRFAGALQKMMNTLPGKLGRDLSDYVKTTLKSIEQKGGSNIGGEKLAPILQALSSKLDYFSKQKDTTVLEAKMLSDFSKQVGAMVSGATQKGFRGLGSGSRDAIKSAYAFESNKNIDTGLNTLAKAIDDTAKALSDKGLQQDVLNLKAQMRAAADAAKTGAEKLAVLSDSATKLEVLKNTKASGKDRDLIDGIVQGTRKNAEEIDKKNILAGKEVSKGEMKNRWTGIWRAIGTAGSLGSDLKRIVDSGNAVFQAVNSRVNAFARMQMGISSERGSYGRIMRGAGLNFDGMMAAIGAGRGAGMEDSQVVNQMAGLGVNLARARWGEGPLIDNLGKWGLTPYDANGRMKSSEQVMIDMSRKLRSMTDTTEKLQFLAMQGINPEQMEYVANFEKNYDRMQYLKRNPGARGVLERADILDENGMNARIDAATKIELKRRQILNQNAIDEGIGSGLIRSLHPENWFFNDWTARQKGVEVAKSDKAMENLTRELRNVRSQLKENGGSVSGLSRTIEGFGEETLMGMSLTKGWAAADLANRGNESVVHGLRKLYAQQFGLENLDVTESRNKHYNSAIGILGGGAIGALTGLFAGAISGALLGTAAGGPIGTLIGMVGGAIGGGLGLYNSPLFSLADDGSQKHIEHLRKLAQSGDNNAISDYMTKNNLMGLDAEVIKSKAFQDDEKAAQILQGAYTMGLMTDAQALTESTIDPEKALLYNRDKYYIGNKRAAENQGKEISRERVVEAMARAGSGDNSTGLDAQSAYNAIAFGYDRNTQENQLQIRTERARLMRGGKSAEEAQKLAEEKVENEWFASNITQQDVDLASQVASSDQSNYGYFVKAQKVLESKKNEKSNRIAQYLAGKNIGGQKTKGYSNELNSLSDDALVENIALNTGMSADDVRNNIGTGDAIRKRIFEKSKKFRDETQKASEKESKQKKTEEASINDAATFSEAAKMIGDTALHTDGSGYVAKSLEARERYLIDSKQQKRLSELRLKKARVGLRGDSLSEEEQKEYDELAKREENTEQAKVDRKKLIKLVAAGGGKLSDNFSAEEISEFQESEAKEKELFLSNSKNNEGRYQNFKNIQARILQGEKVTDKEREWYNAEERRINKAKEKGDTGKSKQNKGASAFEEEYVPTAEESAAISESDKRSQQLSKEQKAAKGKRSLNQMAAFRGINELRAQGMNDKDIFKRFGRANYQAYKAAVASGEIQDPREVLSREEKKNDQRYESLLGGVRNKKGELLSREEYEKKARAASKAANMDGKRLEESVASKMEIYDSYKKRLDARENAKRRHAAKQSRAAKKGNINPANLEEIDKEPGFLVGEANKEAKEEQAAAAMEQVSSAAEKAAASGNEAKGGDTNIQTTTTMNVGGVRVEQVFNGITPNDPHAVGEATRTGAEEGIGRLASVVKSDVGNRNSTT